MRRLILAISFFSALTSCSTAQPEFSNTYNAESSFQKEVINFPFIKIASTEVPDKVSEYKNITYVRYGKRELQLDLYAPEDLLKQHPRQTTPGVVLVHGGGWRSGCRENLTPLAIALAESGYVAATISYRLAPEEKYPAAIHDVKAAIRWLRENANEYHVDPDKIVVGGASAGGQIASLTGVTNNMPEFDPQASDVSSAAQLILNIDGLSDFTSEEARKHEDDPRKNPSSAGSWFGGRYAEKTELWHQASPLYYVNETTPPILFLNSARERFHVGRDEMIEKMEQYKIPYKVETLPDTPHTFWLFEPWLETAAGIVVGFIEEQFQTD